MTGYPWSQGDALLADDLNAAIANGGMSGGTLTGPLMYVATGGTVLRSAQDRAADVVYAADYVSIQAAHDALPSTGGVIVLPRDVTVTLTATLVISKPNVTLQGQGWGSVIRRGATGLSGSQPVVQLTGANCVIRDLTVDGGNVFCHGAEIDLHGANCVANRCQTINPGGFAGISLTAQGTRATQCKTMGTGATDSGAVGIWALGWFRVVVDFNWMENCGKAGVTFNGQGSQCIGNYVRNCHSYMGEQGGVIAAYYGTDSAVGTYGAVIANNTIDGGGPLSNGIEVEMPGTIVDGNSITGVGVFGIIVYGAVADGVILSNNLVRNCAYNLTVAGIHLDANVPNTQVLGNRVIVDNGTALMTDALHASAGCVGFVINGNSLTPGSGVAFFDQSAQNQKVISDNFGIDNVIPSVASAGTIVLPVNPVIEITGATNVTSVAASNAKQGAVKTITTMAAGITFTAGVNIGNTYTSVATVPFTGVFLGNKWYFG